MMTSESVLRLLFDARSARTQGRAALQKRQRVRLDEMVTFARAHSPYYRELYQNLPDGVRDPARLPVTDKKTLMARFNDWVTDRDVTIEKVQALVQDPGRIGERFLGQYTVITTSGTTGTPGIFVQDDRSMAVTKVLAALMVKSWLEAGDIVRILAGGGRTAMVIATGGHFATTVAATRMRSSRWRARLVRVFPVHMPLPEMVAALNRFRPAMIAAYASVAKLLASEQEAGRLHIKPVLLSVTAEGLPEHEYERIAKAFGATVRNGYAANECPFLSYGCAHGWLHVNSDWLVLEAVDADYRPIPPGQQSHTVLLSNLANRVQPILRYDLGDSILQRSDPCSCGNPLPAIRVRGRSADVLTFSANGERITIVPLVFATLLDRIPGIELFQIVQTTPSGLRVRLRPAAGTNKDRLWQEVSIEMTRLLAAHKVADATLELAEEAPEQSAGGKFRHVIPLT